MFRAVSRHSSEAMHIHEISMRAGAPRRPWTAIIAVPIAVPLVVALLAMLATARDARADEWIVFGAQHQGMGGTGEGFGTCGASVYWNPASMWHYGRSNKTTAENSVNSEWDVDLNIGASLAVQGELMRFFNELYGQIDFIDENAGYIALGEAMARFPGGATIGSIPQEAQAALGAIATIGAMNQETQGAYFTASTGFAVRIDFISVYTSATAYVASVSQVDVSNLALFDMTLIFPDGIFDLGVNEGAIDSWYENLTNPIDGFGSLGAGNPFPANPTTAGGLALEAQLALAFPTAPAAQVAGMAAIFEILALDLGINLSEQYVLEGIVSILVNTQNFGAGTESIYDITGGGADPFTGTGEGSEVRGIVIVEFGASGGYEVYRGDGIALQLGVTLKGLVAKGVQGQVLFEDAEGSLNSIFDQIVDQATDLDIEEFQFSFDLGVVIVLDDNFRIGIVARNLTNPQFNIGNNRTFRVEPQIRLGIAYDILPNILRVAADIDVLPNDSYLIPRYGSQILAVGLEWKAVSEEHAGFALRTGVSYNFHPLIREEFMIHGGFGFRLWLLQFDFAGAFDPNFVDLNTQGTFSNGGTRIGPFPGRVNLSATLTINATW